MTNDLYYALKDAADADFARVAEAGGMECASPRPSEHGCFLVRNDTGVWLIGPVSTANPIFGRTILKSVWTPLNVAVMRQEPIGHLL